MDNFKPGGYAVESSVACCVLPSHWFGPATRSRVRRKLSKDVRGYVQKCVDKGKEVNLTSAINKDTITRGLR